MRQNCRRYPALSTSCDATGPSPEMTRLRGSAASDQPGRTPPVNALGYRTFVCHGVNSYAARDGRDGATAMSDVPHRASSRWRSRAKRSIVLPDVPVCTCEECWPRTAGTEIVRGLRRRLVRPYDLPVPVSLAGSSCVEPIPLSLTDASPLPFSRRSYRAVLGEGATIPETRHPDTGSALPRTMPAR